MEAQGTAPSKKNGGGPSAACRLTPGHVRRGDAVGVGLTAVRRAGETKLHAFTEGVRMAKDIWAPWRIEYILGPKSGDCAFCLPEMAPGPERDAEDRRRLVVWRGPQAVRDAQPLPVRGGASDDYSPEACAGHHRT